MKSSKSIVLLSVLFLPVLSDAQEIDHATRSLEEQQAISYISQAEFYTRMALRSLEASEKIGKAPYFNYQDAREDIEKVLTEFKTYLKGDEFMDLPPAVPLIVDGRYFAESIKDFLATRKADDAQAASNLQGNNNAARSLAPKTASKNVEAARKKNIPANEQRSLKQNSAIVLPPPALTPQNAKAKRDKIEEILKKGL
jgi:arginine/lysine/ornithine decarboxylase